MGLLRFNSVIGILLAVAVAGSSAFACEPSPCDASVTYASFYQTKCYQTGSAADPTDNYIVGKCGHSTCFNGPEGSPKFWRGGHICQFYKEAYLAMPAGPPSGPFSAEIEHMRQTAAAEVAHRKMEDLRRRREMVAKRDKATGRTGKLDQTSVFGTKHRAYEGPSNYHEWSPEDEEGSGTGSLSF